MLSDLSKTMGGKALKGPVTLKIKDRSIALMHEPVYLDALTDSGHFDLIISGHTHNLVERRRNNALIVNPGETCGYLTGRPTSMICDLEDMTINILEL